MTTLTPYETKRLNQVQQSVSKHLQITIDQIRSPKQDDETVFARHTIAFFAFHQFKIGKNAIAKFQGKKQHGTVINSLSNVTNRLKVDKTFKRLAQEISEDLNQYKSKYFSRQLNLDLINENVKQLNS